MQQLCTVYTFIISIVIMIVIIIIIIVIIMIYYICTEGVHTDYRRTIYR